MWTFLLLYASLYATSSSAKKFSSSSNSIPSSEPTALSNSSLRHLNRTSLPYNVNKTRVNGTDDRRGYQKDIMVVLPVMQGVSADLDSSNLQILYTKPPVTAIIDDKKEQTRISSALDERMDQERNKTTFKSAIVGAVQRHPYTEFLANKTPLKTNNSPLDYGYPASFKFVQEFNDLPKNHKPGWASTNQVPDQTIKNDIQPQHVTYSSAASVATKDDPFQMFESIKPMEINKIFAVKPSAAAAVNENVEETSTIVVGKKKYPEVPSKRPFLKRIPAKKPSRNKTTNVHKLEEIESVNSTTVPAPAAANTVPPSSTTTEIEPELYTAARYSTLFAESTKYFLPTPHASVFNRGGEPLHKSVTSTTAAPTSSTRNATTTAATTRSTLSDLWKPIDVNYSGYLPSSSSDSSNLQGTILLGENLASSDTISAVGVQPLRDLTTRSPFPNDKLTNNMKNMLISLGILKSEDNSVPVFAPLPVAVSATPSSTTTEYPITRPKPISPVIDPNSYSSFKKIPINSHSPKEQKSPVSDDMRELLASFGLLPKRKGTQADILTRISRQQHKLEALLNETNAHNKSNSYDLFPDNMEKILDNLGLLKPLAYHYNPQRAGHVFQPTIHLEKLGDEQKVQKINEVIDTIRRLSKSKDIENLSAEELEKQLENVTAILKEDDVANGTNVAGSNTTKIERTTIAPFSTTTSTPVIPVQITTTRRSTTTKKTKQEPATSPTTTERDAIVETGTKNESSTSTSITVVTRTSVRRRPTTTTTPKSLITVTPVQEKSSTASSVVTQTTTTTSLPTTTSQLPLSNGTSSSTNDNSIRMDESVISVVKFPNATTPKVENIIMTPPNPLSPDELLQLLEFNKNDVKRQQPNETTSNFSTSTTKNVLSTTNATLTSSSTANSTNQNEPVFTTATNNVSESSTQSSARDEETTNVNPSVSDLADSFGGGETASEESSADDFPTPRPNGLYFYLDWNTFLNVGEANSNPIRIRFSPRAGNPRLFLPITVP